MKVKDLINKYMYSPEIRKAISEDTNVLDVDEVFFQSGFQRLDVVTTDGKKIGEVDTQRLEYATRRNREIQGMKLLDYFNEAIILIDKEGKIFYVNKAYTEMLKVIPRKIIGKHINDIEQSSLLFQVLKKEEECQVERRYVKSVDRILSLRMFPLYRENVLIGACSMVSDITEIDYLKYEVARSTQIVDAYNREQEVANEMRRRGIIGKSRAFRQTIDQALIVSKTDASILITGANGVGKEVIARLIHSSSSRKNFPIVTVNCSAIPENLAESELFGYEKGSFTGAKSTGQIGKFELADGGTIFLDEIGDMPLSMQVKILRVLEKGEIEKIGRQRAISVDVRIIAATNQPLEEMIEKKLFRKDLYYRLKVVELRIPSLNERGDDVILLANFFLQQYSEKYKKKISLSDEAYAALRQHEWPGNVRELQNCLERAVIFCQGSTIGVEHLSLIPKRPQEERPSFPIEPISVDLDYRRNVAELEKRLFEKSLETTGGNRTEAMKLLGLSRRTFYRRLKELKLSSGENGT